MKQTFYETQSHSVLSKYSLLVFDKASFQYPVYSSISLIALLSHNSTLHITTTKEMFGK
jgi:hypothetical protein